MRKGDDGEEKKTGEKKKEKKTFLVATDVVASRSPERWPTETPTARANMTRLIQALLHSWNIQEINQKHSWHSSTRLEHPLNTLKLNSLLNQGNM